MEMTLIERIHKFIEKHPEPVQFKIKFTWQKKSGPQVRTYGTYPVKAWRSDSINVSPNRKVYAVHFLHDAELELCEIAYVTIDTHTPQPGDDKRWYYLERYFVPKGTRNLYDRYGIQGNYVERKVTYTNSRASLRICLRSLSRLNYSLDMFQKEFLKFVGNNIQTAGYCKTLNAIWQLNDWFEYKSKEKTKTEMQNIIDMLTAKELPITKNIVEMLPKYDKDTIYNHKMYVYFDAENMVFRQLTVKFNNKIEETHRVYIYKGKIYVVSKNDNGEWVKHGSFTERTFNNKIINDEEVWKIPYMDYIKKITNDIKLFQVISAMKHPEIEQLVNMEMYNIAKSLYQTDSFNTTFKQMFGEPTKKKHVCSKAQLTKKQLEIFDDYMERCGNTRNYYYHPKNTIFRMKKLLNMENISSLDCNIFTKYLETIESVDSYLWDYFTRYNDDAVECLNKQRFDRIVNMHERHADAVRILYDTIRSYSRLINKPQTHPFNVKSYDELVRLHNACIEIQNAETFERNRLWRMQEAERNKELEKKMVQIDEERSKLNYEEEIFSICLPKKLSEITDEGMKLHHCVGGYAHNHANGNTTILFLRKNSEPEKPFYTIELRNERIIQIHGFGNKWLGNDPEAIPTVMRWLHNNNISCSDQILLSTAKGYGAGNAPFVEKPCI